MRQQQSWESGRCRGRNPCYDEEDALGIPVAEEVLDELRGLPRIGMRRVGNVEPVHFVHLQT